MVKTERAVIALGLVLSVGCGDDSATASTSSGSGAGLGSSGADTTGISATSVAVTGSGGASASSAGTADGGSSTAAGGASSSTTGDPVMCTRGTWTGIYESGFETLVFMPCDRPDEVWWFMDGGPPCELAVVTIEGMVCGPGMYGMFGIYEWEFFGEVVGDVCLPAMCEGPTSRCGPAETICGG